MLVKTVLNHVEKHPEETLRGFFTWLGEARSLAIRFVCSDMWKPYLNGIAEKAKKEFSNGADEGLNNKIKTTARKSYGFKSVKVLEIALYHTLGNLPLPPITHRIC